MLNKENLQDLILDKLQRQRRVVSVFTTNGYRMTGRITAFDQDMVVVEIRNEQHFVYKHAVSTISPDVPVDLDGPGKEGL